MTYKRPDALKILNAIKIQKNNDTHIQETHGPHCSPEKPVQINKQFLYHIIDQKMKILIISLVRIEWFFFWTNLISLYPRMLCAKCGWNWPNDSGEEDKNVKSLQTDGWQAIKKADFNFQLMWANNCFQLSISVIFKFHQCIFTI